jgi:hypothetical protein
MVTSIILWLTLCGQADKPDNAVFAATDPAKLTAKQSERVKSIAAMPETVALVVTKFTPSKIKGGAITIELPGQKRLTVAQYSVAEVPDAQRLTWEAKNCHGHLTFRKSATCVGRIEVGDKMYSVEAVGDSVVVISEVDPTKLAKDK